MKKITSILLLCCLFVPLTVTYILLNYQKMAYRQQIKYKIIAGINKEKLVHYVFSKREAKRKIKWKNAKEFEFNNEMNDIVKSQIIGDSVHYWCWLDKNETKINKQINKLLAQALGNDAPIKNNKIRFAIFYQSLFFCKKKTWKTLNTLFNIKYSSIYIRNYASLILPPPTPPPNIF